MESRRAKNTLKLYKMQKIYKMSIKYLLIMLFIYINMKVFLILHFDNKKFQFSLIFFYIDKFDRAKEILFETL